MTVYVARYDSGIASCIRDRVGQLESGDTLQVFGFEDDATLGSYFDGVPLIFSGCERKGLHFGRSPRIRVLSDRYIFIRKNKNNKP